MDLFGRCNESVAAPRQRLDKTRTIRRVSQHFAQPHHCVVQPVIEIDKSVPRPKALSQFVAGNDLAGIFQKYGQNLKRLFGQLQPQPMLTQFERFEVNLEDAAAGYFRRMDWSVHGVNSGCDEV